MVLKLKPAKPITDPVKASFRDPDDEDNVIKEMIPTFADGQPLELLISMEKALIEFGKDYELFQDGKWKKLLTIARRALTGSVRDEWAEVVDEI